MTNLDNNSNADLLDAMADMAYQQEQAKTKENVRVETFKEKTIEKIVENPEIGKPMRYQRKGTREVYLKPFRLVYSYNNDTLLILFLDLYHKDTQ